MAADQPDKIIVECTACSGKLRIAASSAGKKFKCPKCGQVNTVPAQAAPAPPPQPAELDLGMSLAPDPTPSSVGAHPAADYAPSSAPPSSKKPAKAAASTMEKKPNVFWALLLTGNFARGCLFSGICSLAGAIAWCIVIKVTNYEFGYLAWGIGIATGAGMAFGYKSKTLSAGAVAAFFAVAGILAGKVMAAWFVFMPMLDFEVRKQDPRIFRLAYSYRQVEGVHRGLHPLDEANNAIYEQRAEALAELSDAELDQEISKLDAWENGGRDSDSEYVQHALAFCLIAETPEKPAYNYSRIYTVPREEWPARHQAAMQQVNAMSESERAEAMKAYRKKTERYEKVTMLAYRRSAGQAIKEGLAYADERRETLADEEIAALWKLSDDELKKAEDDLEAWDQQGRWADKDYVRNFVIFNIVDQQIEDRAGLTGADDDEEYDEDDLYDVSGPQWEALWTAASLEVEGKEDHELRARADEIVSEQEAERERLREETSEDYEAPSKTAQVVRLTPFLFKAIVEELDALDVVFLVFAVGTAFGIGVGGYRERD